jgi:hypothetical protein
VISTVFRYARDLDRVPDGQVVRPDSIDPAPILGEWSNANRSTWGISRAGLVRQHGGIDLHIIAADPLDEPHDWGRVPIVKLFTDGPGSSQVCGYTAAYELGHARTQIQANMNHGLTVIAALTNFTDGSGRCGYLSREFFCRRAMPAASARPPLGSDTAATRVAVACGDDRLPMLCASIDPAPLLCQWRNADEASRGIAEIRCKLRDDHLVVRVVAVGPQGPIDWGEVVATLHTDLSATGGGRATVEAVTDGRPTPHYADISATDAGPAFLATYDHGFQRVHLQARINLGVLVVAMFSEFTDDTGRADYFHREVFIPAG